MQIPHSTTDRLESSKSIHYSNLVPFSSIHKFQFILFTSIKASRSDHELMLLLWMVMGVEGGRNKKYYPDTQMSTPFALHLYIFKNSINFHKVKKLIN